MSDTTAWADVDVRGFVRRACIGCDVPDTERLVVAGGALDAPDSVFHEIVVRSVVERLPAEDLLRFWRELYRVCKKDAVVLVAGVYWSHVDAHADPTRLRGLSERMFAYLSAAGREIVEEDICGDDFVTAQLAGVEFAVKKVVRATEQEWESRSDEAKNWGLSHSLNVARWLEVTLVAVK